MDKHYFNINIATKYGINCAVILQNICFWISKNAENNQNFYDNHYWMYNPIKDFKKQFPYLTERQIRSALDVLKEEELVVTANYNKTCDRTLWYTVTQKALDIMNDNQDKAEIQEDFSNSNDESIVEDKSDAPENSSEDQKCQNEVTSMSIRNDTHVNTYCHTCQNEMTPVSNGTNNKPQIINTDKLEKEIYKEKDQNRQIFDFWNSKQLVKEQEFNKRVQAVISTALKSFTLEQILLAIDRYEIVYNSNNYFNHGWDLDSFLGGSAVRKFLDNGIHWVNYCNWEREHKTNKGFIHNLYTTEQIESFISNLDEVEV